MEIDRRDIETIYDTLCAALTDYEDGIDNGDGLYAAAVDVANRIGAILN